MSNSIIPVKNQVQGLIPQPPDAPSPRPHGICPLLDTQKHNLRRDFCNADGGGVHGHRARTLACKSSSAFQAS